MALSPGELIARKYRIESLLGEGGMGAVYVATNERLHKRVALKVLHDEISADPEAAGRFTREAIAASRIKHRGVVEIFDADVHDGTAWIAMELLEGESLGDRLKRGTLGAEEAIAIAREIVSILSMVHAAGIIHRDLKPDNVFLEQRDDGERRVKVLDFGIAKIVGHELGSETKTGMAMGTPFFLSPEQATNAKQVDARADIYSIGVILFRALSGELPYVAESFGELVRQFYTAGPRSLRDSKPELRDDLVDLVDRCLAVQPDGRPASAAELADALAALAEAPMVTDAGTPGLPGTLAMDAVALGAAAALSSSPGDVSSSSDAVEGAGSAPVATMLLEPEAPPDRSSSPDLPDEEGPRTIDSATTVLEGEPQATSPDLEPATPVRLSPVQMGLGGVLAVVVVGAMLSFVYAGDDETGSERGGTPPPSDPEDAATVEVAAGDDLEEDGTDGPADIIWIDDGVAPPSAPEPLGRPDPAAIYRVPLGESASRGRDTALVTIVEFCGFHEPYSARLQTRLQEIRERWGREIRIVFKHLPHPDMRDGMAASEAAIEVQAQLGDASFFRYHDTLFEHWREVNRANLERWAAGLRRIDMARFRAALDNHVHRQTVEADQQLARSLGLTSPPNVFINGRRVAGIQPFDRYESVITEELARAREQRASGTPRSGLYAALIADGATEPQFLPRRGNEASRQIPPEIMRQIQEQLRRRSAE